MGVELAGAKVYAAMFPSKVWYRRANGFSNRIFSIRKKASVTLATTITHGRNSWSRSHLRSVTSEAKADMSHDQNRSDPACPPHQAVILR